MYFTESPSRAIRRRATPSHTPARCRFRVPPPTTRYLDRGVDFSVAQIVEIVVCDSRCRRPRSMVRHFSRRRFRVPPLLTASYRKNKTKNSSRRPEIRTRNCMFAPVPLNATRSSETNKSKKKKKNERD